MHVQSSDKFDGISFKSVDYSAGLTLEIPQMCVSGCAAEVSEIQIVKLTIRIVKKTLAVMIFEP